MEKEQYRFEMSKVYEFNGENAYEYLCNFIQAGIKSCMPEKTKIAQVEKYKDRFFFNDDNQY